MIQFRHFLKFNLRNKKTILLLWGYDLLLFDYIIMEMFIVFWQKEASVVVLYFV